MVRIVPWHFGDQAVKLLWYGNIHLQQQKWKVEVAFEVQGKLEMKDYPVGLLPLMRLGQWYHDGLPLFTQKEGLIGQFTVADIGAGSTVDSLTACKSANYYLHGKPALMQNKLRSIVAGDKTYYVPYLELLRALFATNKDMSNAVFRPNGLSYLVDQVNVFGKSMDLRFTSAVSKEVDDHFIQHIAWILSDPRIQNSFESVFSYIYANSSKKFKVALEFSLASISNLEIHYRGIERKNDVLVLEILGIDGFDFPLDFIEVRHPSYKERKILQGPKKTVYSGRRSNDYDVHTEGPEVPKVDTNQPVIKHDPTRLGFRNDASIRKVKSPSQIVHKGNDLKFIPGRGGAVVNAGVDESIAGGNLQPVDIQSLEISRNNSKTGLEQFLEVTKYLERHYKDLKVQVSVFEMPTNRAFAFVENGNRRKYALAKIQRNNRVTYIVEVACPDDHSVTTLLLYPNDNELKNHEDQIQKLMRRLVFNQGHWPHITEFGRSKKLRHTMKLTFEWAQRIYSYL